MRGLERGPVRRFPLCVCLPNLCLPSLWLAGYCSFSAFPHPPHGWTPQILHEPLTMRITILGCGDAFGSGGRFQAATLVESGDIMCLLDCGASTMPAINARGIDP